MFTDCLESLNETFCRVFYWGPVVRPPRRTTPPSFVGPLQQSPGERRQRWYEIKGRRALRKKREKGREVRREGEKRR